MLEEEYQQRRVPPPHLRRVEPPEAPFEYSMRDARLADMPAVREIYNYYVANSTVTFDEDAMTLREWRAKFTYLHKLGMPFLVAESPSGQLLGYALVAPWKQKRAYRYTVENSIYVDPNVTGRGIGRRLLAELIAQCTAIGCRQMIAVIGDSANAGSIKLHEALGFKLAGNLRSVGRKKGRWLDSVLMQLSLGDADKTDPPA